MNAPRDGLPQVRVVEDQAIADEPKARLGRPAVVERDREERHREVVGETERQDHDIGVVAQPLVQEDEELLVRSVPLHRQVSDLDPVVPDIEQVSEGLLVGDAQAERDGIAKHDDAGAITRLRQGRARAPGSRAR